ncbi:single-stranded DNA-binding protein [Adlercreutzia sp. ZJ141]|uniref:single-stranded DNA-binding protein n=1 Tax=Adlercreutzia sp. ZJ141 TaxID=2709406 RepID=UPI0013EC7C8C|nr:single-stranded DNA-binding protein [Adlercreutzia sp. ZJ141]
MSLNTCAVSGNLGKAAELRYTASGLAVVSFSVAVNERRRQADGSYQDEVSWLDCVMFGSRAEALHPYLAKGSKLTLAGHLHQSTYERDGHRRSKIEIIVDDIDLMNTRRELQAASEEVQQPVSVEPQQPVGVSDIYDTDVLF